MFFYYGTKWYPGGYDFAELRLLKANFRFTFLSIGAKIGYRQLQIKISYIYKSYFGLSDKKVENK